MDCGLRTCDNEIIVSSLKVIHVWWIRRVTCFFVEKIPFDPSQAQVDQEVHPDLSTIPSLTAIPGHI